MTSIASELAETDKRLRRLIELVFATNSLFPFTELNERIIDCIEIEIEFLIYIREKAWFSKEVDPERPKYLKFGFLSFEYRQQKSYRFKNPLELSRKEDELLEAGYATKDSELCRIIYRYRGSENVERILNLLMRIFVAFYKNCGSYDHFRESVASRFIKDFFRENPSGDDRSLVEYIERVTNLRVSLWKPADEMYFRAKHRRSTSILLKPFSDQSSLPVFGDDPNFVDDLATSVIRRNQTFGRTVDGETQYVVKTFSTNHFSGAESRPWSGFKVRQRAVAIFTSGQQKGEIRLDSVYHAGSLIQSYLKSNEEMRLSNVLHKADEQLIEAETNVSEHVRQSKNEIDKVIKDALIPIGTEVALIMQASQVKLWIHDPLDKSLRSFFSLGESASKGDTNILHLASDQDCFVVECFASAKVQNMSHPDWIESETVELDRLRSTVPEDRSQKQERLKHLAVQRAQFRTSMQDQGCSGLAIPVRRSGLLCGVLEITSTEIGQMSFDRKLAERFASICGDVFRRIELANDRAWLRRMSFIHASRHRLEELLRDVEAKAGHEGKQFVSALRNKQSGYDQMKGLDSESRTKTERQYLSQISRRLTGVSDASTAHKWINRLTGALDGRKISIETLAVVADIIDELVENGRKTSGFALSDLEICFTTDHDTGSQSLLLTYETSDEWITEQKMSRVGYTPIPSISELTFHIGLFLLGSQVRMLGGVVDTNRTPDDIGNCKFALAFRLPVL